MKLAVLYLIVAAALYGSISTVAKPTLNSINPILLSSLTYLIIGIVITFIIKLTGHIYNPTISDLKLIAPDIYLRGCLGSYIFFLWIISYKCFNRFNINQCRIYLFHHISRFNIKRKTQCNRLCRNCFDFYWFIDN